MPIPTRKSDEEHSDFINRCMSDPKMREEYDYDQRFAVCNNAAKSEMSETSTKTIFDEYRFITQEEAKKVAIQLGLTEIHSYENKIGVIYWVPGKDMDEFRKALLFQKEIEESASESEPSALTPSSIIYTDSYIDLGEKEEYAVLIDGNLLVTSKSSADAFEGKKIALNKPFHTPGEPTEFAVYTKGSKGGLIMLKFNSNPNATRNDSEPTWTTKYWQYKMK